jgi:hypothetical protein
VVGLLLVGGACAVPEAEAQQRKDDSPRFGNGAFLRRIFGEPEPPKKSAAKGKTPERLSLEASRQRFKEDTDKLKEKLGFGPTREPGSGLAQGQISDREASLPRSQFAPQSPTRQSISDYGDALSGQTPPLHFGNPALSGSPPTRSASAPGLAAAPASGSPRLTPPPTWRPEAPERSENSVMDLGPRNQPKVPAQPTLAVRPSSTPLPSATKVANPDSAVIAGSTTDATEDGPPTTFGAFGIIVDSKASGPGLAIKAVRPKSIAATIGLKPGDVLQNVAGLDIGVVQEIDSLVEVLEPEDEFEITFVRQGKPQTQTFSVPQK